MSTDLNMDASEIDRKKIIDLIDLGFGSVDAPEQFADLKTVDDFIVQFGADFFPTFWKLVYHLDRQSIKYVLPFAMKYYLTCTMGSDVDSSLSLELLIAQLDPRNQPSNDISFFYEETYKPFDKMQRSAICHWLRHVKKDYQLVSASIVRGAILYWC